MRNVFGGCIMKKKMKMKKMTAKELIDKLDINTKENLWDIIVDGSYYDENKTQTLNSEVKTWSFEYCIVDQFFKLVLKIYTANCKLPYA